MRFRMILKYVEGNAAVGCQVYSCDSECFIPRKKMTFSDSMKGRNFPTRRPIMNSRRATSQGVVISNLQENCQIASKRGFALRSLNCFYSY